MDYCKIIVDITLTYYLLFLFFSLQRRTRSHRLNSHRRHKKRRKEEVAAVKPRRRSGRKERFATSWTIKFSSTKPLTRNCTRKFHSTSSSPHRSCLKDWRSVDHWLSAPSSNCVTKVMLNYFFILYLSKTIFSFQDWLNKLFTTMPRWFSPEPQRETILSFKFHSFRVKTLNIKKVFS